MAKPIDERAQRVECVSKAERRVCIFSSRWPGDERHLGSGVS